MTRGFIFRLRITVKMIFAANLIRLLRNWRTGMLLVGLATLGLAFLAWQSFNGMILPLAVSPDGQTIVNCELVYHSQLDRVHSPRITLRNSKSGKLIASFDTPFDSRPYATFNADGSELVIVDESYVTIFDVETATIVDRWVEPEVIRVLYDKDGQLFHVGITYSDNAKNKKLWIKKSRQATPTTATKLDANDHIDRVCVLERDSIVKVFCNSELRSCGFLLNVDLQSGSLLGSEHAFEEYMVTASPNGERVVTTNTLWNLNSDAKPIKIPRMQSYAFAADSKRLFTANRDGQIFVIDEQGNATEQAARFNKDPLSLRIIENGNVAIAAAKMGSQLQRSDLALNKTTTLVDMKRWFLVFFVSTCILAPCWVVGWIYFGLRDQPGHPFLDMLLFHSAVAVLLMECGYLVNFRAFQQVDEILVMLALSLLGTSFGIMIVWTVLCVRRWDWQIPFATAGIAIVLAAALWASRNMQIRSWEIAVVGTSIFICTAGVLIAFRHFVGRIVNVGREPTEDSADSAIRQISLKQILISLSAFALCFSVGRFLQVTQMPAIYYIWLVAYGVVFSSAISGGVWIVFGPYVWWSRILISSAVMASIWIGHFVFTLWLNLNLGAFYYAIPMLVNAVLLVSLTYCRLHGFTVPEKQISVAS